MNRSLAIVFASLLALGATSLAYADGTAPAAPQAAPAASAPAAKQAPSTQKGVHKASKARRGGKSKKASTPPTTRRK